MASTKPAGPAAEKPTSTAAAVPLTRVEVKDLPRDRTPFQWGFFAVAGGLVTWGLVGIMGNLRDILVVVVLALFLSLGLNPLVEWLTRRGLKRGFAVPIVALAVVGLVVLGVGAVIPVVVEQGVRLAQNLPGLLNALNTNPQVAAIDAQFNIIGRLSEFLASGSWVNALFGGLVGAGMALASTGFSIVMTVIFTLYFLGSIPEIKSMIYQMAPASKRPRVRYLADEMFMRIGNYLTGMFVVVTLWAIGSFIVMMAAGLSQYALALCILVGLFAFIPMVGWMFAAVIVGAIALSVSPTAAIICLAYFFIYSQMDAYLVQPRLFSTSLNVPPVLIVLGAVAGGTLLGLVGALLAIPTVASLLLLYREVLVPKLDAS